MVRFFYIIKLAWCAKSISPCHIYSIIYMEKCKCCMLWMIERQHNTIVIMEKL